MSKEREKAVNEFVLLFNEWKAKVDKVAKDNNIAYFVSYNEDDYNNSFETKQLAQIYTRVNEGENLIDVINEKDEEGDEDYCFLYDIMTILELDIMNKTQYYLDKNCMVLWNDSSVKWENL